MTLRNPSNNWRRMSMILNPSALKAAIVADSRQDINLKELRQRLLKKKPWKQFKDPSDGHSNINQNDYASSVNNEQIRKDNNLTGQTEDASEMYQSIVVDGN